MKDRHVTLTILVLIFSSVSLGIYLISDYYMDDGWPSSFGQVCGDTVGDDCAYINSHLNTFGLQTYDTDISCTMMLDAGKQKGARYKFHWKRFELEGGIDCPFDSLTMYDAHLKNVTKVQPFGKFCGSSDPNMTGFPTQQYVTLKFKTDGGTNKKGFRLLATRTVPYPCPSDDFYHCKSENRCIDSRLQCDGTVQCDDETDEDGCSFWEKMIGGFLALGIAGMIGIVGACLSVCIGVGVVICICTCCRKQCACLFRCCRKCCDGIKEPVRNRVERLRSGKVGAEKGDVEAMGMEAGGVAAVGAGAKAATTTTTTSAAAAAATTTTSGKTKQVPGMVPSNKDAKATKTVPASKDAAEAGKKDEDVATARDVVLKTDDEGKVKATDSTAEVNAKMTASTGDDKGEAPKSAPDVSPAKEPGNNKTTTGLADGDQSDAKEGVTKVDTK